MTTPTTTDSPVGCFDAAGFCKTYHIGRTSLYAELATGRLTAHKIGKKLLIRKADAEAWATSLPRFVSAQ